MQPVLRPRPDVNPTDVCSYRDLLGLWLSAPLNPRQTQQLRECLRDNGGSLGKVHYETWNPVRRQRLQLPALRQRLQLRQPSPEPLRLLDELSGGDAYLNHGEVALDLIFPPAEVQEAGKEINRLLVKRYHRQEMLCYESILYFNRRWAATNLAPYHDRLSKLTGEPCVHLCSRTSGHKSMLRHELGTLAAWIALDHREYWRKRLRLCDLDRAELGRRIHNLQTGSRRRAAWVGDHRTGYIAFKQYGFVRRQVRKGNKLVFGEGGFYSVQQLVDNLRHDVDVYSCLVEYDTDFLLDRLPSRTRHRPRLREQFNTATASEAYDFT